MKKGMLIFTLGILLTSFAFASITGSVVGVENNSEENQIKIAKNKIKTQGKPNPMQIQKAIQVQNRLRVAQEKGECPQNCNCTGSTTRCQFRNGTKEMIIRAGKSDNTIIQVKGVNMSTKAALYRGEDGEVYGIFKNNKTKIIKIMPDEIKQRIRQRIKARLENQTIELDEDGEYVINARKRARLFGLFPVKEKIVTRIDSETGDIIRTKTSWWGFLARDNTEEEIACTADAKICADGTALGREGPNCEFPKCPEEEIEIDEVYEEVYS